MTDRELFEIRKGLLQVFLQRHGYGAIVLNRIDNFAMATGGKRNYINIATDMGACALVITRGGDAYYVGDNIEETRVMAEELHELGCETRSFLWFESTVADVVKKEFSGTLVSDDGSVGKNVHTELSYLRSLLSTAELEKFRRLGPLAAEAMVATLESVRAGDTEQEISARLAAEGAKRRFIVQVNLIAADDRIAKHRHPLPTMTTVLGGNTENRVNRYVMVVGCFLREGLTISITRFKWVDTPDPTVVDAYNRMCGVEALTQEATQPGKTLGEVFAACQEAYATLGFDEREWYNHHQGGAVGYSPRTRKGSPGDTFPILDGSWAADLKKITGLDAEFGHAFAWNPSGQGTKSEDTFILLPDGRQEIVSQTPALPQVDLEAVLGRPTNVVKSGMAH